MCQISSYWNSKTTRVDAQPAWTRDSALGKKNTFCIIRMTKEPEANPELESPDVATSRLA